MNEIGKIRATIAGLLAKEFPKYPVAVTESPEDVSAFWVRVFAVPADQVRTVKDFIHGLQVRLLPDMRYLLLPMVKNLETTRQHYPEYLPTVAAEPPASMLAAVCAFQMSLWHSRDSILRETIQHRETLKVEEVVDQHANEELAPAA